MMYISTGTRTASSVCFTQLKSGGAVDASPVDPEIAPDPESLGPLINPAMPVDDRPAPPSLPLPPEPDVAEPRLPAIEAALSGSRPGLSALHAAQAMMQTANQPARCDDISRNLSPVRGMLNRGDPDKDAISPLVRDASLLHVASPKLAYGAKT
jgi:hypothetical protein